MYTVGVVPESQSRSDSNIQSGTPRTPGDRSKSKSLCENQPTVPGPRDCHRKKIPTQKSLGERTRERGRGRGEDGVISEKNDTARTGNNKNNLKEEISKVKTKHTGR